MCGVLGESLCPVGCGLRAGRAVLRLLGGGLRGGRLGVCLVGFYERDAGGRMGHTFLRLFGEDGVVVAWVDGHCVGGGFWPLAVWWSCGGFG